MAMSDGAIDADFDSAERSAREQLEETLSDVGPTEPMEGGIAIDLVTRQPLFVRRRVADDLAEYYEENDFDLLTYKTHPYLPVTVDDPVYECVFVPRNTDQANDVGQTYDYPRGRLMMVPIHQAWGGDE